MHVPEYATHHRDKFRTEKTSYALWEKKTNFWQQMRSENLNLLSEICLFSPGSILCRFGAKKIMVVRNMVRYMRDLFRNFSISFQILKIRKAYRVQVHPGAKVNFREKLSNIKITVSKSLKLVKAAAVLISLCYWY